MIPRQTWTSGTILSCGLFAAVLAGCSELNQLIPLGPSVVETASKWPSFTAADEERMARANALEFEKTAVLWDDPLLETYVTDLTQRIVAVSKPCPFAYRVRVVKDPTINAFTFGGGLVYVYAGLIARMENEAQLAMVLGHEIAHVTEGHVPEGIQAEFGIKFLGQLAVGAAGEAGAGSLPPGALEKTYQYALQASINGHGRTRESEADEVGLEYMFRAGFDPREAPGTFRQLLKEHGDKAPLENFLYGSHPTNVSRIEHTTKLVEARYAGRITGKTVANSQEFQRRTRELVVATGLMDYEAKRFQTARAMFEKALSVSLDDPVAPYYLGRIALETGGPGQIDDAIAHFIAAMKTDGRYAPARRELGLAYYRKGDKPQAVAALEGYLALLPDAPDASRIQAIVKELERE